MSVTQFSTLVSRLNSLKLKNDNAEKWLLRRGDEDDHWSTRIAEHMVISFRTDQTLLNRDHALHEGHDIKPNYFFITHKTELSPIIISESIIIKIFHPRFNDQNASTKLTILG